MQAVLARGGERPLPAERQRQRANVRVAAGQLDDLSVDAHEPVERGGGGVSCGRDAGCARVVSSPSAPGPPLPRVAICFSMRVIAASSASAMCGACSTWISRTAATAVAASAFTRHVSFAASSGATAASGIAERVGRLLSRTERQPLRLEVGVLDRQRGSAVQRGYSANRPLKSSRRPRFVE